MPLRLDQSSDGYRYSIDAFLLADFCTVSQNATILDIGSGCGIVSFLLARLHPDARIFGIEIQSDLVRIAEENLKMNAGLGNIHFIHGDIRDIARLFPAGSCDIAVSNPPYHPIGSGRINPHPERASARHELKGGLGDFIRAGSSAVRSGGHFYTIYTAHRTAELIDMCRRFKLEPKMMRTVHPRPGAEANLVLMKAARNGRPGLRILPPLFIYEKGGEYSEECAEIAGKWDFAGEG
ncbi:MAG: tRNA1(Val) (adenine(37)-N6)-methyltransferase [bacterium]